MNLRRGKTKNILESSRDSALLAVEIYNKPRTPFRSENYITLMVMAWTKLFHAYFYNSVGDKYYYKHKNGRYQKIDGEKKTWELKTCMKNYKELSKSVEANLNFFIGLRNKIEHRCPERNEIDTIIFGECQSFLYNYENTLIEMFGEEYAINESLAYSLQFSAMRTEEQVRANKAVLSTEIKSICDYINKYKTMLSEDTYNSQEYSIKLIQIPKISNTSKFDLAIEFVKWSDEDKENYEKLNAIVKDKIIKKEVVNVGKLKAGDVVEKVKISTSTEFNHHTHKCFYYVFSTRPLSSMGEMDPFNTNTKYCNFDELHGDYVYQDRWVDFIIKCIENKKITIEQSKEMFKNKQKLDIVEYL